MFTLRSISEASLTTPTSTQKFPLGSIIDVQSIFSESAVLERYMYIQAGAALAANSVYLITNSSTANKEVTTGTPATSSVYRFYGVAPVAFTTQYYGWIQIEGDCSVISATDTVATYTGKAANGVVTMADEGATTISASSLGIWKATGTGSAARKFYLFGTQATVA